MGTRSAGAAMMISPRETATQCSWSLTRAARWRIPAWTAPAAPVGQVKNSTRSPAVSRACRSADPSFPQGAACLRSPSRFCRRILVASRAAESARTRSMTTVGVCSGGHATAATEIASRMSSARPVRSSSSLTAGSAIISRRSTGSTWTTPARRMASRTARRSRARPATRTFSITAITSTPPLPPSPTPSWLWRSWPGRPRPSAPRPARCG